MKSFFFINACIQRNTTVYRLKANVWVKLISHLELEINQKAPT